MHLAIPNANVFGANHAAPWTPVATQDKILPDRESYADSAKQMGRFAGRKLTMAEKKKLNDMIEPTKQEKSWFNIFNHGRALKESDEISLDDILEGYAYERDDTYFESTKVMSWSSYTGSLKEGWFTNLPYFRYKGDGRWTVHIKRDDDDESEERFCYDCDQKDHEDDFRRGFCKLARATRRRHCLNTDEDECGFLVDIKTESSSLLDLIYDNLEGNDCNACEDKEVRIIFNLLIQASININTCPLSPSPRPPSPEYIPPSPYVAPSPRIPSPYVAPSPRIPSPHPAPSPESKCDHDHDDHCHKPCKHDPCHDDYHEHHDDHDEDNHDYDDHEDDHENDHEDDYDHSGDVVECHGSYCNDDNDGHFYVALYREAYETEVNNEKEACQGLADDAGKISRIQTLDGSGEFDGTEYTNGRDYNVKLTFFSEWGCVGDVLKVVYGPQDSIDIDGALSVKMEQP